MTQPTRPLSPHETARTPTADARNAATIADAQRSLSQWLPRLVASPGDAEARGEVAASLLEMGNERAGRAVSRGMPLLLRGAILYVCTNAAGAVGALGGVGAGEAPWCASCGEFAAELDTVGVEWRCLPCREKEVPW